MAIIVILCGAPHLYKKDMNNSGLFLLGGSLDPIPAKKAYHSIGKSSMFSWLDFPKGIVRFTNKFVGIDVTAEFSMVAFLAPEG